MDSGRKERSAERREDEDPELLDRPTADEQRRTGGAGRAMYEPVLQRIRDLASPGLQLSGSRDEGALIGDVKPGPQPPGRGHLITRRDGARLIQLAWSPPLEG